MQDEQLGVAQNGEGQSAVKRPLARLVEIDSAEDTRKIAHVSSQNDLAPRSEVGCTRTPSRTRPGLRDPMMLRMCSKYARTGSQSAQRPSHGKTGKDHRTFGRPATNPRAVGQSEGHVLTGGDHRQSG